MFMHSIADISGGISLNVKELSNDRLLAGTPIGKGQAGQYVVCKTAMLLSEAASSSTTLQVEKSHHLQVGDFLASDLSNGLKIKSIDRSPATYDLLTLESPLSVELKGKTPLFVSLGNNKTPKVRPIALLAHSYKITNKNIPLHCAAYVVAVLSERVLPLAQTLKNDLKGIFFVN